MNKHLFLILSSKNRDIKIIPLVNWHLPLCVPLFTFYFAIYAAKQNKNR